MPIPVFRGEPREDVRVFLTKFERATIGLSDEMRCKALMGALAGFAQHWAEKNINTEIESGNWQAAKSAILERYQHDREIRFQEHIKDFVKYFASYSPARDRKWSNSCGNDGS